MPCGRNDDEIVNEAMSAVLYVYRRVGYRRYIHGHRVTATGAAVIGRPEPARRQGLSVPSRYPAWLQDSWGYLSPARWTWVGR